MERKFKVVIVGDGGCGKTTLVKKLQAGSFDKHYMSTMGVQVSPLTFETNQGVVNINVWDCAGQEKFGGLRDGYYIGADAFIVMFDLSSRKSYENAEHWANDVLEYHRRSCDGKGKPIIVLCGNKSDIKDRISPEEIVLSDKLGCEYWEISAKTGQNISASFLTIIKELTKVTSAEVVH